MVLTATGGAPRAQVARLDVEALDDRVRAYQRDAKSTATLRAYRSDWADFTAWCGGHGIDPVPASPATVSRYLTHLRDERGLHPSTLQRRLSSISQAHQAAGHPSPTTDAVVRSTLAGIRRSPGAAAQRQAAAILPADLRLLLEATGLGCCAPLQLRDRALLLLGFAGGFRRGELVALDVEDLEESADGLRVRLRRSKTDQEGEGRDVGILRGRQAETCPVRAVAAWLAAAGLVEGPLFRPIDMNSGEVLATRLGDRQVARIVQRCARRAGLDWQRYAGHSLRAGLATSAAAAGANERDIMRQTGHRGTAMVRRYIRAGSLFRDNVSGVLGL